MQEPIQVLDHGYVRFVEKWGMGDAGIIEAGIVEAARQSTQGSFRGWAEDEKLLKTLFTSKPQHAGPFEFAGMVLEIQAPIFVFREWHRHRTQSFNEMSARYAPLPAIDYLPSLDRALMVNILSRNKQQQGIDKTKYLNPADADVWLDKTSRLYQEVESHYQWGLSIGLAKEVARVMLPVGRYSRMRAHVNLRNWLAFLTLRMDPDAQWEIRQYANVVGAIIAMEFPRTWQLYDLTARP